MVLLGKIHFTLGNYFGEVVHAQLAGRKWNFSMETMLSWTVDWDLGNVELQLCPFQRVYEYVTAKISETLSTLWEQAKQADIEYGLAARDID